jgi:hypothetical protein
MRSMSKGISARGRSELRKYLNGGKLMTIAKNRVSGT